MHVKVKESKLKISMLLQLEGFSRRCSLLHDFLNRTEDITENCPLEDLIDSQLLANEKPQSRWLAK